MLRSRTRALLICIVMLGSMFGGGVHAQTAAPTVTPVVAEAPILLATLPRVGTLDLTGTLRAAFTTAAFTGYRATVQGVTARITDSASARDAAKANRNVVAVVWADPLDPQNQTINLHIELLRQRELESYHPETRVNVTLGGRLSYPTSLSIPVSAKLTPASLRAFVQTQIYIGLADYVAAQTSITALNTALTANKDLDRAEEVTAVTDFTRGYLAGQFGATRSAFELFDSIVKSSNVPTELAALAAANQGAVLIDAGQLQTATETLDAALKLDPGSVHALHMRGIALYLQEQEQQALTDFDAALAIEKDNPFVLNSRGWLQYQAGELDAALTNLDAALAADGNRFVDAIISEALIYRAAREYPSALALMNRAISLYPNYFVSYSIRGGIHNRLGNLTAALSDYNRALELNPTYALAYENRGAIYEDLNQLDNALNDYNHAIELDPTSPYAYLDRGHLYLLRNLFEQSVLDLSLSLRLFGQRPASVLYYYRAQAFQGLRRWDDAIKDYNEYIRLDAQGAFATAAKQAVAVIRAYVTPTPTATRVASTVPPTRTSTALPPTRTAPPLPSQIPPSSTSTAPVIPTLSEDQIIATAVAQTAIAQGRQTSVAGTISAIQTRSVPTATAQPPTRTAQPPTSTSVPPTRTTVPPTRTPLPPTQTALLPTSTP